MKIMSKQTHKTRLINYLKEYGSITSLEAIRDLGNTRLSATIFKLRDEGYEIQTQDEKVNTRWLNKDGTIKQTTVAKYIYKEEAI
jgi:biotin operon repressor